MTMKLRTGVALILATFLICACDEPQATGSEPEPAAVLLVCEHGSVKSLMAASLFNQAAAARSLPFRAVSRGVTPDERVPEKIADALSRQGFDVQNFKPMRVSNVDLQNASRIVAIGVDPNAFAGGAQAPVERWDDVPAASVDYAAAHDSLQRHVERLLDELQAAPH
jgi:arsenate reductase (thioredoxin)